MYEMRPRSEVAPRCRLIFDELPPSGEAVWLITKWGNGFRGKWHPEYGVIAWCPLPKLDAEQKRRLMSLTAAGYDTTQSRP